MLITELKSKETIESLVSGKKVFVLNCHGCKEVHFPEKEAVALQKELPGVTGVYTTDYICNEDNLDERLPHFAEEIDAADAILVCSCGVGVQTIAGRFPGKNVFAGCDTYPMPGFQGVTPLEVDCKKCGQCYLSLTGGICPVTACSKSLLNGQCGGAKCGKCEVDASMDCGWERIYRRLEMLGRLDAMKCPVQIRDYSCEEEI